MAEQHDDVDLQDIRIKIFEQGVERATRRALGEVFRDLGELTKDMGEARAMLAKTIILEEMSLAARVFELRMRERLKRNEPDGVESGKRVVFDRSRYSIAGQSE